MIVVRFCPVGSPANKQVQFLPFSNVFDALTYMLDMYGDTVHVSYAAPVRNPAAAHVTAHAAGAAVH